MPAHMIATDPAWFPARYHAATDTVEFREIAIDSVAAASFLDQRAHWGDADPEFIRVPNVCPLEPASPPVFIFHTGFCGSTLLSRILQDPPRIMSLREPQALLDLAHAAHHDANGAVAHALAVVLDLLARPWSPGGRCLIKPSNHCNNLMLDILRISGGRAVLLYSTLEEFILSRCKQLPDGRQHVLWMAQHLLRGSRLQRALGVRWDHPFHFVEACVLAWHVQLERFHDVLEADTCDRLRSLDFAALLADPTSAATACAHWLELGATQAHWSARVDMEMRHDAKHGERHIEAAQRSAQRQAVRDRFRDVLDAALVWSRGTVEPLAQLPTDWKPLLRTGS